MSSTVRLLYVKRLWRKASTCKGGKGHRLNLSSEVSNQRKVRQDAGFETLYTQIHFLPFWRDVN